MESVEKKMQKRERSVNFTHEETALLVSLAEAKKGIIENKKSDSTTWQEKEKAWKDIEIQFNSLSGSVFRDHKHLKQKYESIKRDTRKKSALVRAERYKTGGGPSNATVLTPVEQKVKEMILLSVEGNESRFDSDFVLPKTPISDIVQPAATSEQILRDDSSFIYIIEQSNEPPKKVIEVSTEEEQQKCESTYTGSQSESQPRQWKEWNPAALKTKKHPVLNKLKEDFVLPKTPISDIVQPAATSEQILRDDSSFIHITEQCIEPPRKVVKVSTEEEQRKCESTCTGSQSESQPRQWKEWNPTALKTKKHPVLNKVKEKKPFDILTEEKIAIAKIQKEILSEELEQKLINRDFFEKELQLKNDILKLEKEHVLLKIKLLKKELGEN